MAEPEFEYEFEDISPASRSPDSSYRSEFLDPAVPRYSFPHFFPGISSESLVQLPLTDQRDVLGPEIPCLPDVHISSVTSSITGAEDRDNGEDDDPEGANAYSESESSIELIDLTMTSGSDTEDETDVAVAAPTLPSNSENVTKIPDPDVTLKLPVQDTSTSEPLRIWSNMECLLAAVMIVSEAERPSNMHMHGPPAELNLKSPEPIESHLNPNEMLSKTPTRTRPLCRREPSARLHHSEHPYKLISKGSRKSYSSGSEGNETRSVLANLEIQANQLTVRFVIS